jgi:Holliday junction DNA helicase RuvA
MIARLRGLLIDKHPTHSIIECQGVGYEVFHTPFTADRLSLGKEVSLHIHTHVKEDILQLYGFSDELERESFRNLIRVSSVGPKLAMGILSSIAHQELWVAIQGKDFGRLQRIPGIGKKTAERLSLELKDKIPSVTAGTGRNAQVELESVLVNLGYQRAEIQRTLSKIESTNSELSKLPLEIAVKQALAELTRANP